MNKIFILLLFSFMLNLRVHAQGCVAIRSNGGTCIMMGPHINPHATTSGWSVGLNSRYFRSFRHFVGKEEQKQRQEAGTEVINHAFSTELGVTRFLNNRWSLSTFIPVISNTRSSLYEHDGKNRYNTHSFGIGDMRIAGYWWILDPSKVSKSNVQLGAGLKLATGDYRYSDYFHKTDSTKVLGPIDQSIQLGDGGTGITTEVNAFYHVTKSVSLYANGFYLINPREQNGVSTARGGTSSAASIAYGSDVMSVPDQYMVRAGGNVAAQQWMFSAGMRMECVPVKDLVGGSNGFRRPGYVLSVEPVVAYKIKSTQIYLSVPYAVQRNRTQSIPDKIRTRKTGVYAQGDAAFSDYSVNFGITCFIK